VVIDKTKREPTRPLFLWGDLNSQKCAEVSFWRASENLAISQTVVTQSRYSILGRGMPVPNFFTACQ
jgi:hypothetical protein